MKNLTPLLAISCLFATAVEAAEVPKATHDFVADVAVSNKFEIDTSELALKYGKAADVRNFAQQMITDHTAAGQKFKAALAEASIQPPADSLDVAHTAKYAKLRVFTTEAGFDASYTQEQLKAHEDAVAKFEAYATSGPTPALKTFANDLLPTLRHHLQMVKDLEPKVRK
ncbi:DUF4142 domain-containing protein [Hyphomicrobium methylovorum]|uniref:DUF4142 domain-containing protein n=1 Tax=Hyphomicrobium methylovorum TaxID=84 RepID=UPI0015E72317|nr:DUF4142 domain-containing protein [Hyphomicrobium methylovorum]